jgi:hypothetical protein
MANTRSLFSTTKPKKLLHPSFYILQSSPRNKSTRRLMNDVFARFSRSAAGIRRTCRCGTSLVPTPTAPPKMATYPATSCGLWRHRHSMFVADVALARRGPLRGPSVGLSVAIWCHPPTWRSPRDVNQRRGSMRVIPGRGCRAGATVSSGVAVIDAPATKASYSR